MQNLTTGVFTKHSKASFFQTDVSRIIILFLFSAFVIYFLQPFLARVYFILLVFGFWYSKKDYFWFAFIFLLIEQPAGFFSGGTASDLQRLPLYTVASGVSFAFYEIFILVAFLKALVKGKKTKLFFDKPLKWLFIYLILLLVFSFLFGMNEEGIVRTSRILVFWTLFISFPYLLKSTDELLRFCTLLFPFIFLVFAGQIYELINGVPIIGLFKSVEPDKVGYSLKETENIFSVARFISAPFLNLFCFISSLFIINSRINISLHKFYLYAVSTICYLSVLFSATRGWFLAYTITAFLFFITSSVNPVRIATRILVPLLIFFALYSFMPAFKIQINNAMVRINTLEGFIHGDITLGGTQKRTTVRSVQVMNAFYKNPLTGWGFSYNGNHDGHVGNQNLLQSTGLIGFFLFFYFWLFYIYGLLKVKRRIKQSNPYKNSLLVLIYGFVGIFVIHSTSTQMFGYDPQFTAINKILFLVVFFVFSDIFMKEAMNIDIRGSKIH